MTKIKENIEIIGAGLLMEKLFKEGTYQSYKLANNSLEAIKKEMRKRVPEELTRKHFEEQGVIARYIKQPTYDYDVIGLNEFLWDLGILHQVARFNDSDELENFRKPIERFTKFNIGKLGRVDKQEYNFETLTDEQLVNLWVREKNEENRLEDEIEIVKNEMLLDPTLNSLPEGSRKLSCSYGSISLLDKKRTHHNEQIISEFGETYAIYNSSPNMEELEKFVVKGYLTNKDVDKFRTLIDMKVKFVMMSTDSYQKQGEVMHSKRMRQAKNMQELWSHKKES